MPDMVCVKCQRKFRIEKNGVEAIEFTPTHTKEGKFLRLQPYQIHSTDKWKCPGCGIEVLAGFGQNPWAAEWMKWKETPAPGEERELDFTDMLRRVITSNKITHVNYTDFSQEDQTAIENLIEEGKVTVILATEGESHAQGEGE
jgi:hypothetical protein